MTRLKIDLYWQEPPPEPSPSCRKWVAKIEAGWRPNRRISGMGYYTKAEFFNVYVWEYLNVIRPLIHPRS